VVTDSGTLKWILDAYTSRPATGRTRNRWRGGTNYLRNSVKVVIDAYDGTVDAYLVNAGDPVIRTYAAIFGPIFKPLAAMPADLGGAQHALIRATSSGCRPRSMRPIICRSRTRSTTARISGSTRGVEKGHAET